MTAVSPGKNETGQTNGLLSVHWFALCHLQKCALQAMGLPDSVFLINHSGPKRLGPARELFRTSGKDLFPDSDTGAAHPTSRVRGSPPNLAALSLLCFIEVKPILKFHSKTVSWTISPRKEASPLASHSSGRWGPWGTSQSWRLLSSTGYVCACLPE